MCFIIPPSVFLGTKPSYYIADMDLCKEIFVKHFDKFVDRIVSSSVPKHFDMSIQSCSTYTYVCAYRILSKN